jgi:hypothetical protein
MQGYLTNVSAKGSRAMMILAMNIVGGRPADRNKTSSRCNGKEPAFRQKHVDDFGEANSTFTAHHPTGFVEAKNAVQAAAVNQFATIIEARVAITAPQSIWQ